MMMNLPFIGATTFHLFTIFPTEPPWVVRHPRVRFFPYLGAGAVALLAFSEGWLGPPPDLVPGLSFAFAIVGVAVAIGMLTLERLRARATGELERADVVVLGAIVSFVPVLLAIVANLVFRAGFPTALALIWFAVFPVAVAWGIVRNQLFDLRGAARSSAAYGAATLAITGLFALLITTADAVFARFNVNARTPAFQVAFLFFAILAFNPLRIRLQSLVDRFFDRDRAGYRSAVREISEAMVSMLLPGRDQQPSAAGGDRHHGRRALHGAAAGRRRAAPAARRVARRVGRGDPVAGSPGGSSHRQAALDAPAGAHPERLRRHRRRRDPGELPRRLRLPRGGAPGPDPLRRGPAGGDRRGSQALRRAARHRRPPAAADPGEPRAPSPSRTLGPSTRSPS